MFKKAFLRGRLPHTRGGVSFSHGTSSPALKSSPHPWGCFPCALPAFSFSIVFPTPVGVFLFGRFEADNPVRLPHTRGGVSQTLTDGSTVTESSPHPWGCFCLAAASVKGRGVFPTPVGVFPATTAMRISPRRLPHTRGGVSEVAQADSANGVSSCTACRFSSRCSLPGFLPQHNSRPA